jgi:glutathione peroxidase-family protein
MSYTQITEWHKEYPGLEIVLFPSDEFGGQEKPENEIAPFVSGYGLPTDGPGCTVMSKVETNGSSPHPVWAYVKSVFPGDVTWNFGCWALFDKDGKPVGRFSARELSTLGDSLRSSA